MSSYLLGSTVRLTVTFRVGDVPTDPTTVTLEVGDSIGSPSTYTWAAVEITRSGPGVFYREIVPDLAGTWVAIWTGAGDVDAVEQQEFDVIAPASPWDPAEPRVYASLSELLAGLRLDSTDPFDEFELRRNLQEASRQIDGEVTRRSAGVVTGFTDTDDYPTVPAPIRRACILIAIALYKRPEAPFGVLQSTLDGTPIQIGKDFHVDALIDSVVPTSWLVV